MWLASKIVSDSDAQFSHEARVASSPIRGNLQVKLGVAGVQIVSKIVLGHIVRSLVSSFVRQLRLLSVESLVRCVGVDVPFGRAYQPHARPSGGLRP